MYTIYKVRNQIGSVTAGFLWQRASTLLTTEQGRFNISVFLTTSNFTKGEEMRKRTVFVCVLLMALVAFGAWAAPLKITAVWGYWITPTS
jgi:hypothetical protein